MNTAESQVPGLVDLRSAATLTVRHRLWILGAGLLMAALLALRAIIATPIYRSEAVVSVAPDPSGSAGGLLGGQLGAIASLAGIEIGGADARRSEYLAILMSKAVVRELIKTDNLMPVLFRSAWDEKKGEWRQRMFLDPPSLEDAVEVFSRRVLEIVENRKTGLITVRVEWRDPAAAAAWASRIVDLVNAKVRNATIAESQRSMKYLREELARTETVEVKEGISRLLEGNLNRVMIANVQEQYALRVVDPPVPADQKRFVRPRPLIESVLGFFLGAMVAFAIVLWRFRRSWWLGYAHP